jgi:hypothetical protein
MAFPLGKHLVSSKWKPRDTPPKQGKIKGKKAMNQGFTGLVTRVRKTEKKGLNS